MDSTWYLNRLRKMSLSEVLKRFAEHFYIYYSQLKFHNPAQWPYSRFADDNISLVLHRLPGIAVVSDWKHYQILNAWFDLTRQVDWHFSDLNCSRWPSCHYSRINYRPANPYGDVRINWELSRLQFLPAMAVTNEDLVRSILADWLIKNPYLHGPGYLSSMEVALRWLSIYWAVCLFRQALGNPLRKSLTGMAVSSGNFIENHLSTHSSAGNHLIVEAVGLFWLGKALENNQLGVRWLTKAREVIWEETLSQLRPDGTNREQSFWYLGFVLDALFHYFLLEDKEVIPGEVKNRMGKATGFIHEMILPDGSFPDYGDRDDGFVLRLKSSYAKSPFPGLVDIGRALLDQPELCRGTRSANDRLAFWNGRPLVDSKPRKNASSQHVFAKRPELNSYSDGGMTLMKWGKGRLLFRHANLGLKPTYGHGHADALSILFFWNNIPVLVDLGSGQYNGDQAVRNFFRSTIAHNTIEIGGKNQAKMLGPFMWEKSYETNLAKAGESPVLFAEASHDGYMDEFSVTHTRRVEWFAPHQLEILDSFSGPGDIPMRGAFHLGACPAVIQKRKIIEADFGDFVFSVSLPSRLPAEVFYGSKEPFMGWRSTIYGRWEPIYSIVFSGELQKDHHHKINLRITEK